VWRLPSASRLRVTTRSWVGGWCDEGGVEVGSVGVGWGVGSVFLRVVLGVGG